MSLTKTLSVRVPLDVAIAVENTCKLRNITKNQLLHDCIASQGVVGVQSFAQGGSVEPIPEILGDVLIGVGGVSTGTLVYHLLKNNLPKEWGKETIEIVSIVSSIASGFAVAYGLNSMREKR